MDYEGRGYREERYSVAHDLVTGEQVPIVTGWTPDLHTGAPVMVMAVGDGPTLVLDGDAAQLRVNIAASEEDLKQRRGRR